MLINKGGSVEKWVSAPSVRDQFGFSNATIGTKYKNDPVPWIRKKQNSNRFEVDIEHEGFKEWLPSAIENSERRKKEREDISDLENSSSSTNKKDLPDQKPGEGADEEDEEKEFMFAKLAEASRKAKLEKPIIENALTHYKTEQAKLKLEGDAGRVVPYDLVDFMWLGYLDRINQQHLLYPKKFEPDIDKMLQSKLLRSPLIHSIENEEVKEAVIDFLQKLPTREISREIVNMNVKEMQEIIRLIKKEQASDVLEWKKDMGLIDE